VEQRKKDIAFIPAETVFQAIAAIFPDMGSPSKLCQKFVELTENKVSWPYIPSYSVADPHHADADPDPCFYLIRIRIRLITLMRIQIRLITLMRIR
jgi:hypothetical protein